ncbi:MAG: hypothetical protein FJX64_12545, partial [Alphaproteobacteria bacterium]|nr:hypothetical protein [Alphaproteobacteria bacterium]
MSIRTASFSALLALVAAACADTGDVGERTRLAQMPAVFVALNRSAPGVPAREPFVFGPNAVPATVETLQHYEEARVVPGVRCYEYRLTLG